MSYAPAVTVALVTNPSSVHTGDPALLTWSSTNATSCTGINFSTGGALSGSVEVSPAATTDYTVTCTNGSGSFDGTASDTERVTVENPGTLTVQCMPSQNPSTVYEPVTWESIVEGGYDYVYSWSGSDGLTGSTASVVKTYDTPGQKTATLSVTSTSPVSYHLVHTGYYFTKVCTGGENNSNIQQPHCGYEYDEGDEGFECSAATVNDYCKITPPCVHDQVMYSWVARYQCQEFGGEETTVTTQCGDGVSCQYAMCTCDGPECGVEVEEGQGADLTVSEQPALYSGLNETSSTVRFIGTLRNIGNGTLDGTFANRFQVDIGSNGSYDLNLNVASAAYSIVLGGTVDVVSPEWASVPAGIHAVRLCADTPSSIDETDETNNCGPELTLAVADPGAAVTIDAAQGFVRPGGNVLVTWLAEGEADSCTVSGPGLASSSLSGTSTVGILGESTFSILCSYDGVIMTDSVTVRIAPRFEEI